MFIGLGIGLNQPAFAAVATVAGTTWNAAASSTDYVLSGGNLTASRPSGSGDAIVKASVARTSGYFEGVPNLGAGGNGIIGLGNAAYPTNNFLGDVGNAIGYVSSGSVFMNGVSQAGTWASFTSSDVIAVCLKASKVYFAKNGVWQNSADPSAGTGGIDASGIVGTGLLPAASTNNLNSFVGRFTTGFTGTIPTGVTSWS